MKGSNGVVAFEVHLDAQAIAGLLELFPKPFCVGYYSGNVFVVRSFVVGLLYWSLVVVCVLRLLCL